MPEDWANWAVMPFRIEPGADAPVREMAPMLRRRAGPLGKMALEVAYQCLEGRDDIPTVFCSRHGEVQRAVDLLTELARGEALSPTGFGLAVHNASAGLFSIARGERANHIALAACSATVEHAVIEACGLLAEGSPMVLLVVYDTGLPPELAQFQDCDEQPHAWAWLMAPARQHEFRLDWEPAPTAAPALDSAKAQGMPGSLEILRFQLSGQQRMERRAERKRWTWSRSA